jgi:hypothetical protein
MIVDVARNGTNWSDAFHGVKHVEMANITSVPNFITSLEVMCEPIIPMTMGVR